MPKFKITADNDGVNKGKSSNSWVDACSLKTAPDAPLNNNTTDAGLVLNTQVSAGPVWKCWRPWFRFNLGTFPDIGAHVEFLSVTVTLGVNFADTNAFTNSGVLRLFKSTQTGRAGGYMLTTADFDAFDKFTYSEEVVLVGGFTGDISFKLYPGSKLFEYVIEQARRRNIVSFMIRNKLDYAGLHEKDGFNGLGQGNQGGYIGTSVTLDIQRFDSVNYSSGNGGPVIEIDYHIPKFSSDPAKPFTINTFRIEEFEVDKKDAKKAQAATATITVADGDAANGMAEKEKIVITSTDGEEVTYVIVDDNATTVATGAVLVAGSDTGASTAGALATGVAVAINTTGTKTTQNGFLVQLKAAIEHINGHNGKITVSAVPDEANGAQLITLTQTSKGGAGNVVITDNISQTTLAGFSGGSDGSPPFDNARAPFSTGMVGPMTLRGRSRGPGKPVAYRVIKGLTKLI